MRITSLTALALCGASLVAQSNTVPGLDGRISDLDDISYIGRSGPAYPNGQIAVSADVAVCNPGSVDLPWYAAMLPDHPKIAFLVARLRDDRIEQISKRGFCFHGQLAIGESSSCGTCVSTGFGPTLGVGCQMVQDASWVASRTWLAPQGEVDPWSGEWGPVGSYFDVGDPAQVGYPAPADGVRSLNLGAFNDPVQNRVSIDESKLTSAGASYYFATQVVHEGEASANRSDNTAHAGAFVTWTGTTWSVQDSDEQMEHGSVLARWPGARIEYGQNGSSDGRFCVASKVTDLGGGQFHYEYAVHNVDNSRAAASFELSLPVGANVGNVTFGDIDDDPGNDWSSTVAAGRLVWIASAGNFLEWNTIYNFGFDCNTAPGTGAISCAQARPGAGGVFVLVAADVPGGEVRAEFATYGAGCEGSTPSPTPACPELNPATGAGSTALFSTIEHCYKVPSTTTLHVTGFDIFTGAVPITVNAYIYEDVQGVPATFPLATGTISLAAVPDFYSATFATPVTVAGSFYIGFEHSSNVLLSDLSLTTADLGESYRRSGSGWMLAPAVDKPAWRVNCVAETDYLVPKLEGTQPLLGSTYDITLDDALPLAIAVMETGHSDQFWQGLPLPLLVPGSNCNLLMSGEVADVGVTDANGSAASSIAVPMDPSLAGTELFHQWVVLDPANAAGMVFSNGGRARLGYY